MSVPCVLVVWSKAVYCSALLGQLHCSSWRKQGTSDFWRTDGLRGLLGRQWVRTGNSRWKDLNGGETISLMIKGAKQRQSCGKWIRVYLTPGLSITPKVSSLGSFYVPNQTGALSSLPPGYDSICWIGWCLYVAWKEFAGRHGPKLNCVGLTLPLLANWHFSMGKRGGEIQHCNACGSG